MYACLYLHIHLVDPLVYGYMYIHVHSNGRLAVYAEMARGRGRTAAKGLARPRRLVFRPYMYYTCSINELTHSNAYVHGKCIICKSKRVPMQLHIHIVVYMCMYHL